MTDTGQLEADPASNEVAIAQVGVRATDSAGSSANGAGAAALVGPSLAFAGVDLFGKLVAFVVVVVLARRLDEAAFGDVVASLALAGVLLALFDFGMNYKLVAVVVRGRSHLREAVARRYQLLGALLLVAWCAALLPDVRPFAVCVAAAAAMAALPTGALLAGGAPGWAAWSLVGPNLVFLALLVSLPSGSPHRAVVLWTVANLAVVAVLWKGVPWVRPKRRPAVGLWGLHRSSLPLAAFNLVVLTYGRIDTVLVGVLVGSAAAGVYGTSYRVVLSVVGLASWSANVAARRLADAGRGQPELRRLLRYSACLAVAASLGLVLFLQPFVHALLGRPPGLSPAARWSLAALPLPLMLINPIAYYLAICGERRRLAIAAIAVALVAAVVYPVAIRAWGAAGAATSSLAVEVTALALFARLVRRATPEPAPTPGPAPTAPAAPGPAAGPTAAVAAP